MGSTTSESAGPTGKNFPADVLERFRVKRLADGGLLFPNGERYYDDGRERKVDAPKGKRRGVWPDPRDVPGDEVAVVEGRADVLSAAVLGIPAVSVPSASYALDDDEALRITEGRARVYSFADCDVSGRKGARGRAETCAKFGASFYVDLDEGRKDGFDVGDVLMEADNVDVAREFVRERMDPENAEHVFEPDALDDDTAAIRNGYRTARERIIDMKLAFLEADDPLPYRVEPLVVDGTVTVLAGRRGEHKSWLGIVVAAGAHAGTDQGPLACEHGPAVYVDAEMGQKVMARRLRLLGLRHDAFVVADGFGLRLPRDMAVVRELMSITNARMVVLDSFRRLAPDAKEDKSDDVTPVMVALAELARSTDVAVVLIHHRSSKAGAPDTRGSSAIEDQADAVWVLERVTGDPDGKTRRRLRNTKQRLDEEHDPVWLDFRVAAGVMTMAEAEPFEDGGGSDTRERVADMLMRNIEALRGHVAQDGGWPMKRLAAAVGRDTDDRAFKDARDLLLASGSWVATGGTRNRRIRPSDSGQTAFPLGERPDGRKEDDADDDPEGGTA
jgi:hypothetical protein